jgi:penicillin-binding protein 2
LGFVNLKEIFEKFGLGQKSGIDLPGEVNGLVPGPAWKEKAKKESWYLGDTYHMAIGQGDVLVTPLQMAVAGAAIVNNGEILKPYLVQKIADKDEKAIKENQKTVVNSKFIDESNLLVVRQGMRDCVATSYGSCRALNDLPVAAAAKTGTAQFGAEGKTHAWMMAFAPYDNPQIVMVVLVEGGGEGFATAGPVVKDVFNWYFNR